MSSDAPNSKNNPGKPKGAFGELVRAETMIQLAIALPAGCVVGWLAGSWADKHFHTNWIGITGILLGAVGGFIKIITTAKQYMKDPE